MFMAVLHTQNKKKNSMRTRRFGQESSHIPSAQCKHISLRLIPDLVADRRNILVYNRSIPVPTAKDQAEDAVMGFVLVCLAILLNRNVVSLLLMHVSLVVHSLNAPLLLFDWKKTMNVRYSGHNTKLVLMN